MSRISVIIPVLNEAGTILRCSLSVPPERLARYYRNVR